MIQIAKRIDDTIEDGVYSVNEVAEKIGITRQQLARWRKGTSEPTALNLKRFCLLYNISADYILGIERREKSKPVRKLNCTKYTFLYIEERYTLLQQKCTTFCRLTVFHLPDKLPANRVKHFSMSE